MPSSRKRKKGKARKALRATLSGARRQPLPQSCQHGKARTAKPPEPKFFWSPTWQEERVNRRNGQCEHGITSFSIEPELFKSSFEMMISQFLANGKTLIEALIASFPIATSSFPGNLDDSNFRESLKSLYLATGTNSVCSWEGYEEEVYIWYCAGVIIYLEEYEGLDFKARLVKLKMRLDDVVGGGERAATLFFSKRIPCSCLDEKKRRVISYPKTSVCCVCNEVKDCKTLMRCGKCKIVQYCSEECQKDDWPIHQGQCETLGCYLKQGVKSRV